MSFEGARCARVAGKLERIAYVHLIRRNPICARAERVAVLNIVESIARSHVIEPVYCLVGMLCHPDIQLVRGNRLGGATAEDYSERK